MATMQISAKLPRAVMPLSDPTRFTTFKWNSAGYLGWTVHHHPISDQTETHETHWNTPRFMQTGSVRNSSTLQLLGALRSLRVSLPKDMKAIKVPPSDPPKDITTWMSGTAVARTSMAKTIKVVTWLHADGMASPQGLSGVWYCLILLFTVLSGVADGPMNNLFHLEGIGGNILSVVCIPAIVHSHPCSQCSNSGYWGATKICSTIRKTNACSQ